MNDVTVADHQELVGKFKEAMATYRQSEDLINIGAYKSGSNPGIDYAISKMDGMIAYMKQAVRDPANLQESVESLRVLFQD